MTNPTFEQLTETMHICVTAEHRFGTDAFLLADFALPRMKDLVCDVGTGCGIIPMLMSRSLAPKKIFALDIQPQAIEQLVMSLERSQLENIVPVCADLKTLFPGAPLGECDVVTCNPPYKARSCGIESAMTAQKIARHEILCTIDDVCRAADRLLKFGGRVCLCNRPERLCDVISAMKAHGLEPKRLRFVSKTPKEAPWLFLLEGKKGGKPFLTIEPPLYIMDGEDYSGELLKIYGRA